jgi:2-polyprenyl-3-methyl-5-hydroxy-6-metoxy-1,4-benzoquinol methylase
MQERHQNRSKYFEEQIYTTEKYVIPFLNSLITIDKDSRILEIGCGEGGNLKPFVDLGCDCVGVDLSESKIEKGISTFSDDSKVNQIKLICDDIYKTENIGQFDVIILRDVIEHIHDQEKFMSGVSHFLAKEGKMFFGFPPWYNPFGGHQQICYSKLLSKLPWFHVLPMSMYKWILKAFGEPVQRIEDLAEIKETGITIERFEGILKRTGFKIDQRHLFLFNPNYEIKFGLKPRKQFPLFAAIPFFRNWVTTAGYYLVSRK